jgi:hypothetical protein
VAPGDIVVLTGVDRLVEGGRVRAQIADEHPAAKSKGKRQ